MYKEKFSLLLPLALVGMLLVAAMQQVVTVATAEQAADSVTAPELQHLATSDDGVQFVLETATLTEEAGILAVEGLDERTFEPGAPRMPFFSTVVALPPEATASVSVSVDELKYSTSSQPIEFAPQVADLSDDEVLNIRSVDDVGADFTRDAAIYEQDALYPETLYTVSEPMYYRDIRFVQISLYPVAYNPVTGELVQRQQMSVDITFENSDFSRMRPMMGRLPAGYTTFTNNLLNPHQASMWRSVPQSFAAAPTVFPIGVETVKIEINEDGIYDLSYAELAAAGLDVDSIDPATFEMMFQGDPVAFQFIGDSDDSFESGESVRFYGWAFDGTRRVDDYVGNNVFWLWAGGTSSLVTTTTPSGSFPVASDFMQDTMTDENDIWWTSLTNDWASFDNEPDQWFWDRMRHSTDVGTFSYNIDLVDPATSATEDASLTVELMSRNIILIDDIEQPKNVEIYMNSDPNIGSRIWYGRRNVNITGTVSANNLINGVNTVNITSTTRLAGSNASEVYHYLNEIRVTYPRQFKAVNDALIFTHAGEHQFDISAFTTNGSDQPVVWNITDRMAPSIVPTSSVNITGTVSNYTYSFVSDDVGDVSYAVMTADAVSTLSPADLSIYTAPSIDPVSDEGIWIAITHSSFMTEAVELATHRGSSAMGGLSTIVVDVEDVYNQYGYGYPTPGAIQDYISHAMDPTTGWSQPPEYVLLFGDANSNMQGNVYDVSSWWDPNEPSYVVTDLQWIDRWNGMVPTDHTYATLVGIDIIPDIAIGRISAQTSAEASSAVDKIITYETNQLNSANYPLLDDIIFISDDYDPEAGDFCFENEITADLIPNYFTKTAFCRDDYETFPGSGVFDTAAMRADIAAKMSTGVSIVNYRGHGAIRNWAHDITATDNFDIWDNQHLPSVVISLDCLDGEFARPGFEALSETILAYADGDGPKGSAAHWSSTGLGYSQEHRVLAAEFYEAVFELGMTALGDAIIYSKTEYVVSSLFHESEIFSFTLQGDPALQLYRPDLQVTKTTTTSPTADVFIGSEVEYSINLTNNGIYPGHVILTDTIPTGMSFITYTSSVTTTLLSSSPPVFQLHMDADSVDSGMAFGESATITLTVRIDGGGDLINTVVADSGSLDLVIGDNTALASIIRARYGIYLPATLED